MDKSREASLVKRINNGEESAFREFYEEFFPRVYKYVARRVNNREASEDITSETFFKILKGLRNFEVRGDDSLDVWVYSITRNVVNDWFRKNTGVEVLPLEEVFDYTLLPIVEDAYSTAEREDVNAYLQSALNELPVQYKEIIEMRFYKQKKLVDIAFEFGKSVDAVKVMQFRALCALKEKVKEKLRNG